jgi:zinc protease
MIGYSNQKSSSRDVSIQPRHGDSTKGAQWVRKKSTFAHELYAQLEHKFRHPVDFFRHPGAPITRDPVLTEYLRRNRLFTALLLFTVCTLLAANPGISAAAQLPNSAAENNSAANISTAAKSNCSSEPSLQMFAVQDSKLSVAQELLPNGLKVVVLEDHSFPTISCLMWYHVGSRNEAPGLSGMSHLVEHMLFKNAGVQKPGDIPLTLARIGADFNGYTSQDFTAFFETLPATRLELALRIEAARMCNGNFTQTAVTEELKHIAGELETKKCDLENQLSSAVHAAAYQVHPYRIPACGWPTDIRNLNARSAQAFYDRYYVPNNATLVIVGNVAAKNAFELAQQYFSALPKNAMMQQDVCTISEPLQTGSHLVTIKNSSSHQTLQLAYRAPAISDPDAPAMAVMESLFNSYSLGGFYSALIPNRLCSSVSSAFELRHDPGLFVITCSGVSGGSRQKAIETIDGIIANLGRQSINEQDLRRAKNSAEFSFLSKRNSPYRLGFDLGYFDTVSDWRAAFSWPRQLQAVSSSDIQRVARKYFDPDTRVIGWAGLPDTVSTTKSGSIKSNAGTGNKTRSKKQNAPGAKEPKTDQQRRRFALNERVPVLCFQQSASPEPLAVHNLSNGKTKELSGSASKVEFSNSSPVAAKYGASIANKLSAIQSRSLSNGLRLVVFESHLSPVVQITGAIEAGQVFDPLGKNGLSELTAASFNIGSISSTKSQFIRVQEDLGISPDGMLHFEPELETIRFHSVCLARDLKTQLELLGGVLSPTISADMEIDQFKATALSALKQSEDTTIARVNRTLLQNLISSRSPYYPVPPFEKAKIISNLQARDLKAFHDKYVVPGATVIVIAGDTTLDESARILEKALANWTAKTTITKVPPVELSTRHILRTSVPIKEDARSIVCLGQLLEFGITSPQYVNLLAAGCTLTEHPILSRMGLDRSDEEPAVANALGGGSISSCINPLGDRTAWSLSLTVQPSAVSRTVRTLLREARGLSSGGLSPVEVAEIKRYLAGAVPVRCLADVNSVSRNILNSTLQSNWPDFYQPLLTGIYSLSADSLNKFLHDSFKPDQSTIVIATRADAIRTLRKQAFSTTAASK